MSLFDLKSALECLKLAPRYLAGVGSVCLLILCLPEKFLHWLGVAEKAEEYRFIFGFTFLCCFSLLSVCFIVWSSARVKDIFRRQKKRRQLEERITKRLHSLTEEEKKILRFYIFHQTRTNTLQFQDGVVQGLVAAGVIYQSSSLGDMINGFAYNIGNFAWDYLNENEGLLEGYTEDVRTDHMSFLRGMW